MILDTNVLVILITIIIVVVVVGVAVGYLVGSRKPARTPHQGAPLTGRASTSQCVKIG